VAERVAAAATDNRNLGPPYVGQLLGCGRAAAVMRLVQRKSALFLGCFGWGFGRL
jgi:hypothetical protein